MGRGTRGSGTQAGALVSAGTFRGLTPEQLREHAHRIAVLVDTDDAVVRARELVARSLVELGLVVRNTSAIAEDPYRDDSLIEAAFDHVRRARLAVLTDRMICDATINAAVFGYCRDIEPRYPE